MTSMVVPSSNVTASASSSSTSINMPSLTNNNKIDAKNLLRIIHNQSLQACCDVGESGVPTDESLVPRIYPLVYSIPEPPTPQTGSFAHQWISAYSLLSPTSKIQAVKALDTLKSTEIKSIPSLPKVIFTTDREVKVSSSTDGTYSLSIHTVVTELAKAKQYTPLTLFTIANTFRLHKEGHLLKKTKSSIDSTIYHLLDLLQFEAEEAMDSLTWQEAWQCMISWLAEVAEPAVHDIGHGISQPSLRTKPSATISKPFSPLISECVCNMQLDLSNMMNKTGKPICKLQSTSSSRRSFTNSPLVRIVILLLAMSPTMHQLIRIRNAHGRARSSFGTGPPPLISGSSLTPCVSSVSAPVIASQNAKKRLRQRANKHMPSTLEDISSVTPMAPLSALLTTLLTLRESAKTLMLPPSTSVPSVVRPPMVRSPISV
ncbi:hypothetical protein PAXRUDRAFT_801994, partial [Paxillus rubicundulus Ve08.2h10]